MTRSFPDNLDTESGSYFLWAFPPILPLGDPRWDRCNFSVGNEFAAYSRGYSAGWEVRDGRLYLKRFGGTVRANDPQHQYRRFLDGTSDGLIHVSMPDVHEVDEPIFATWVTADLDCTSVQTVEFGANSRVPRAFRLFRIERGRVFAEVTIDNRHDRLEEVRHTKALLDTRVAERGSALAQEVETTRVPGLAEALARQCDVSDLPHLVSLLWRAGRPDLNDLIAGFDTCGDQDVRRWIACALGRIGLDAAPAVPMLIEAFGTTEDHGVLRAIAFALASIGMPAASTLPAMIWAAQARPGLNVSRQVHLLVDQLGAAGAGSISVLIAGLLAAQDCDTQSRIGRVLGRMGTVAVPALVRAFNEAETVGQRTALAQAFGFVGREASPALPLLLHELENLPDDRYRAVFAEALTKIGLRSAASLPPLRAAFRASQYYGAPNEIVKAIATLGRDAVDTLIQEFETAESPAARTELVKALGNLGPAAAAAADYLATAASRSSDGALARELAEALRKIGAPASLLATIQTAVLKHGLNSYGADAILSHMRPGVVPSAEAIQDLVALLVTQGMAPAGRQIATLLGAMGPPAVEPLLAALGQVEEARTRHAIINALGMIGPPAAVALNAAVRELAAAQDDSTRLQLVDDVRRLGKPGAEHLETLADVMRRSTFLPIWWRLGLALADLGAPAVSALVKLLEQTQDPDQRRAVANALSQIGATAAAAAPALLMAMKTTADPQTRDALATAVRNTTIRPAQ